MNKWALWAVAGVAIIVLAGGLYVIQSNQGAQQGRNYKIGILVRGTGYDPAVAGFKKRMDELGYHEGVNITYDTKTISDKNKLASTVQDFLKEGVDLINTYSTPATETAVNETSKTENPVPVVFGSVGDPLLIPHVASTNHPGGNVTGVTSLTVDLTTKRLQLLKEFNPGIKKVAMPVTDESNKDLAANKSADIAKSTAKDLGIELTLLPVKTAADNAAAAAQITHSKYDGIIVGGDSLVWGSIDIYIKQAIQEKIPFAVAVTSQVESGALFTLGPDFGVSGRQSADIANKILRGGKPGDIAIQVPQKLTLVLNMDTARKIAVAFPDELVKKADVVIDTGK